METLSAENVTAYLTSQARIPWGEKPLVRELSGGVSNVVLLVERPGGERFVLKQALPRLRVQQEWLCSIERIWREVEVLRLCGELLGDEANHEAERIAPQVPQVLFEDRQNYCFAMTAAPANHCTWRELLLAGQTDATVADACGRLLGRLHARSWNDAAIARALDDRTFFRDLRISPYYDRIAEVHPQLGSRIEEVSNSIWQTRRCLVHGDFSPKNLLITGSELWLIDFEVGHFGDGAFDLGFFLTHLVLKAFVAGGQAAKYLALIDAFRLAYDRELLPCCGRRELEQLWQRTAGALAGCLLARIDGKSPVDYLSPALQEVIRQTACDRLSQLPVSMDELLLRVSERIPRVPPAA